MAERPKVGLALAGGGPEGAVYEIGALRALDECVEGLDLNDLQVYVGVSAGAFVAACLANGLTTAQLVRAVVKTGHGEHPFKPETFFTPAVKEFAGRGLKLPQLIGEAIWDYLQKPGDMTLLESFARTSRSLPVGLFDNEPLRAYLEKIFALAGRTDDFRGLERPLYIVAADLDSGEAVRFGEPGFDHVPISRAVQASTALPGLYPPVQIDGRHYVDGVLLKTLHASIALDAGTDLLFCVNPIVPVDTRDAVEAGVMRRGKLIDRGLPGVLAQTFRTLVHSRMTVGFASYAPRYPDQEVILLEPPRDDYRMFFTNIFSFSSRKSVCEHAYNSTRKLLNERREELEPILESFGMHLRHDLLNDPDRGLWRGVGLGDPRPTTSVTQRLDDALARLEELLARTEIPR